MDNTITVNVAGQKFTFATSANVFSPAQLDAGSRLLIESVSKEGIVGQVLDIGCGYGAIGIVLARFFPEAKILMIDNNPEATSMANENIEVNQVKNARVLDIDVTSRTINQTFDIIVTNPPWTKNKSVIPQLVKFAFDHLKVGGKFYLVINKTFRTEDVMLGIFDNVLTVATKEPYKVLRSTKALEAIDPLRQKVLEQIETLNLAPNAFKDQYFLVSSPMRDKIVKSADIKRNETVLEFGPGLGQLTEKIAPLAKKVIALEVDQRFKVVLDQMPPNVETIYGNAWKIVGRHMANLKFDKVIADLPYSYTEPFLHKLAHARVCPIILTLPEKYTNTLVSHFIFSAVFDIEILFPIARGYFYPIPRTDSIVVRLKRTTFGPTKDNLERWTRRFIYENERMTLGNILRLAVEEISEKVYSNKITKNQAREIVDQLNIDQKYLETNWYDAELYKKCASTVVDYFTSKN